MAYLDGEDEGGPPNPIAKVGAFLAIVAVGLAIKFATTGNIFGAKEEWSPDRVDTELQTHPQAGELYRTVKATYPDEYQAFIRRLAEVAKSGSRAAVEGQAFNFTRQLMVNHFDGLARAPSGRIVEIARQYDRLASTLQRTDVRLCAQLATTGFTPGARPAPEAMAILNRIGVLQLQAARAGETQGAAVRADMTQSEFDALVVAIARRDPAAGRLLSDEGAMSSAPPDRQCAASVAIYRTIAALPAEEAAKVTVSLLRDSFGRGQPAGGAPGQGSSSAGR